MPSIIQRLTDLESVVAELFTTTLKKPKIGDKGPKGDTGEKGPKGEVGPKGDKGDDGKNGIGEVGPKGDDGVGIKDIIISPNDHLWVDLTDGRRIDAGELPKGKDGKDGKVVRSSNITSGIVTKEAEDTEVRTIIADHTLSTSDRIIYYEGTTNITITIYSAKGHFNELTIKNAGTGTITVVVKNNGTIDGSTCKILTPGVPGNRPSLRIKSNKTNWFIV